jgi:hypothetical protein
MRSPAIRAEAEAAKPREYATAKAFGRALEDRLDKAASALAKTDPPLLSRTDPGGMN